MKLKQWLYGATALAMLAACSDKDIAPGGGGMSNIANNGSGYISIEIGMPSSPVTRANDVFGDGLDSEYKVNSLGILFFTGDEATAKFYKGYNITPSEFDKLTEGDTTEDQITSIKRVTFGVEITQTPETLWALAVVNFNDIMSISDKNVVTLKDNNKVLDDTVTIEDLMELTTTATLHDVTETEGFFMTNTPYCTLPGTGSTPPSGFVHLLAKVDKEKIKSTKEAAKADPAAEIFVERAVAKVELYRKKGTITAENLPEISEISWVIDNTEPSSYVIRHLNLSDKNTTTVPYWLEYTHTDTYKGTKPTLQYRFVGNHRFNYDKTQTGFEDWDMYRIYFGFDPQGLGWDPQYGEDGTTVTNDKMVYLTNNTPGLNSKFKQFSTTDKPAPQYCYENTFDVQHMDYRNTTRAIIKVKFDTKGEDFFTRGIDRTTMYTHDQAATTFATYAIQNSDVMEAWTEYFKDIDTHQQVSVAQLDTEHNVGGDSDMCTVENEWIKLTFKTANGSLAVTDIVLYNGVTEEEGKTKSEVNFKTGVNKQNVIKAINDQVTFNAYVGGVAYYAVRIKHFGDDLTPWAAPTNASNEPIATPDTNVSYGGTDANANKNYLGRYGVLRNNWYVITVEEITKFGEPTIGDLKLDGTPDDKTELEKAIACKINILSWAKRTQSVKL